MSNRIKLKSPPLKVLTCDGCGVCCLHMRSPPHMVYTTKDGAHSSMGGLAQDDYDRLMAAPEEARQIRLAGLLDPLDKRPDHSPCSWLDQNTLKCRFYEFRPDICRDFEVGCDACHGHREFYGLE